MSSDAHDLEALGLSAEEARSYLRLIDQPPLTVAEFTDAWPAGDGPAAAPILAALERKGLVTTWAGDPLLYAAVAPDVALDNLARAKEEAISRARALAGALAQRWLRVGRAVDPREMIEIVVGREATLQRAEQIQRTSSNEVLIFDKPPYASPGLGNPIELALLAEGVTGYRCLYDRSALDLPGNFSRIRELMTAGELARVSSTALPMKLVMGDGRVAMMPLDTSPDSIEVAAVVHPSALLESLRVLFEVLWQQAGVLRLDDPTDGTVHPARDATDTDITRLLVTGLTDRAIGRQLGLGERTVQRRVNGIMRSYGVTNRLQLGLRLGAAGWG